MDQALKNAQVLIVDDDPDRLGDVSRLLDLRLLSPAA